MFGDPQAAAQYAQTPVDMNTFIELVSSPRCRRVVERYVVELTGNHCYDFGRDPQRTAIQRTAILDSLEAAARRAIGRRTSIDSSDERRAGEGADGERFWLGDSDTAERPETDDRESPPLTPAETTSAVALTSLVLFGGSLLQLLPGLLASRPIGVAPVVAHPTATPVAPPPMTPTVVTTPAAATLVTPPAAHVDPAEALAAEMEAQGCRWSDRDGWVTDEQAREYQAQR